VLEGGTIEEGKPKKLPRETESVRSQDNQFSVHEKQGVPFIAFERVIPSGIEGRDKNKRGRNATKERVTGEVTGTRYSLT